MAARPAPSRLNPNHKTGFKKGVSGNPNGRPKGSLNKRQALRAEAIAAAGITPLEYMLQVLRDPLNHSKADRMWAAERAAPYVHKKMPIAIEGGDKPLAIVDATKLAGMPDAALEQIAAALRALGVQDEDSSA